jgi:hypothetical protein
MQQAHPTTTDWAGRPESCYGSEGRCTGRSLNSSVYGSGRYPDSGHVCDLALGTLPDWAIEVKLARLGRDNGTYEDAAIKKILSPYPEDRSAVTDCAKLARSGFAGRCAVLIYGFEDPHRPLHWLIEAFEAVAAKIAVLGPREEARLRELVHPVFAAGCVYAWEVLGAEVSSCRHECSQGIGRPRTMQHQGRPRHTGSAEAARRCPRTCKRRLRRPCQSLKRRLIVQ